MKMAHSGLGMMMLAAGALMLAACGNHSKSGTGTLSFSMTDAPVDEAAAVIIATTEFEL